MIKLVLLIACTTAVVVSGTDDTVCFNVDVPWWLSEEGRLKVNGWCQSVSQLISQSVSLVRQSVSVVRQSISQSVIQCGRASKEGG